MNVFLCWQKTGSRNALCDGFEVSHLWKNSMEIATRRAASINVQRNTGWVNWTVTPATVFREPQNCGGSRAPTHQVSSSTPEVYSTAQFSTRQLLSATRPRRRTRACRAVGATPVLPLCVEPAVRLDSWPLDTLNLPSICS